MQGPAASQKILLVEDQALIALAQARTLEEAGFLVETVHTGEASVDRAANHTDIDLILMDIDLGAGIDGTVAATRILASRELPIVFLTSHSEKEMVDKVKGITRYGYVLKNSGKFVLIEAVTMALELFRAHQETRARERRIARLNRTYNVLSDANQAIVRIRNTQELLQTICSIAVDRGDFLFAWIAALDDGGSHLVPVASAGEDGGLLERIAIDVDAETGGEGLTVRSYRSGEHQVVNSIRSDGPVTQERDAAFKCGARSSAAFPIHVLDAVYGVLHLYAPVEGFFDDEEIRLLDELAMDLGFALEVEQKEAQARQAEEERRHWEELMRFVVRYDPNAIAVHDRDLRYLFVSDRYLKDYGVREEDIIGKHHYEVFPEIPEKWRRVHRRALQGEVIRSEDDFFVRRDGGVDYTRWECRPWYGRDGTIGGIILYTEVITRARLVEQERREVFGALQSLLQNSEDLVSIVDVHGRYRMVSASVAEVIGRPAHEIVGRRFEDLLPSHVAEAFLRDVRQVAATGQPHIKMERVDTGEGSPTYKSTLFPAQIGTTGVELIGIISVDLTETAELQAELEENRARWQFALEGAGDGLWDWNAVTNRVYFSPAWKHMLGYEDEEIGDQLNEWESRIHPEDREDTLRIVQAHLEGHTKDYRSEHRLLCRDGTYKWVLDRGKVVERDQEGRPLRVIGTHTDVDERRRLEEELTRNEAKYRRVIEATSIGFWIVDRNGLVQEVNQAYCRMSGYSAEELAGTPVGELDAQQSQEEVNRRITAILHDGGVTFETVHRRRDGSTFPARIHANVLSPEEESFFAIIEDISERRAAERRLKEEMDRRELMVREAHHRIKNDMQNVQALLSLQGQQSGSLELSSALDEASGRIEVMTTLYETIYRNEDISGFQDIVATVQRLVDDIAARYQPPQVSIGVEGDAVLIGTREASQVAIVANELVTNAIKHATGSRHILVSVQQKEHELVLTVRDDGPGFPHATLHGDSTGFGLTVVPAFADSLGGSVVLENPPGGGASATLRFPVDR